VGSASKTLSAVPRTDTGIGDRPLQRACGGEGRPRQAGRREAVGDHGVRPETGIDRDFGTVAETAGIGPFAMDNR